MGARDLDCFQLVILHDEVLALGHLVATAFVFGGDRLMGFLIDELLAEAIAGDLVDLPERNALGRGARRMQRDRTRDQRQFEVAFPVRTHGATPWFGSWDVVSRCTGASFTVVAGCAPLR